MDLSMPIMDGFEASDRIRSFLKSKKMPQPMIVACTGHNQEEFIKKAWRYQIDEVLEKPCDFAIMKELITEMVEIYPNSD